jgi:16S rRNA (adenine1518-N6/adenine1519-N6)-dimethyltransferase
MPPPDPISPLPPLRDVIEQYGLRAKKSLGQNFILDLNITARIAGVCGSLKGRTVVEIGPGPGGLTRSLLGAGSRKVIAIEKDQRCIDALSDVARHWPNKLHVIEADARAIDWPGLLAAHLPEDAAKPLIIANLPYGIATRLLAGWLEIEPWPPWYDEMALMFQKEVAERITARPGTKAYGRLAVLAQWRCETDIALTLPPQAFVPPPKVQSAVVRFRPRPDPKPTCLVKTLARVTAAVFGQRRKMLRTSLRQITDQPDQLLSVAQINPEFRGEHVDIAGFARLSAALDRSL